MKLFNLTFFSCILVGALYAQAQKVTEPSATSTPDWSRPYEPFRIVGNVYYVGTYDLACYLIVTPQGNMLINTGLAASTSIIENNIKTLGFKLSDTKILLTTQAHYDHLGAMAEIKKLTGAKMFINEKDAPVMEDGGSSDYEKFGSTGSTYAQIKADRLLKDGDVIELGGTRLVMLHQPGHTKGSCGFLFDVKDDTKTYKVVIVNMPTIITNKKFEDVLDYPGISKDYASTFDAMKKLTFDLWLSSHANQFRMHSKHKAADAYNPEAFRDREGYERSVSNFEAQYLRKLANDK